MALPARRSELHPILDSFFLFSRAPESESFGVHYRKGSWMSLFFSGLIFLVRSSRHMFFFLLGGLSGVAVVCFFIVVVCCVLLFFAFGFSMVFVYASVLDGFFFFSSLACIVASCQMPRGMVSLVPDFDLKWHSHGGSAIRIHIAWPLPE